MESIEPLAVLGLIALGVLLMWLLAQTSAARKIEQERLRLLREQNALLQRSVRLKEAELRLKLSQHQQQPANIQQAQLPPEASEPPEKRVIIRYGQVHTYTKPVLSPAERDERKEAHEQKIDKMRRW